MRQLHLKHWFLWPMQWKQSLNTFCLKKSFNLVLFKIFALVLNPSKLTLLYVFTDLVVNWLRVWLQDRRLCVEIMSRWKYLCPVKVSRIFSSPVLNQHLGWHVHVYSLQSLYQNTNSGNIFMYKEHIGSLSYIVSLMTFALLLHPSKVALLSSNIDLVAQR